MELLMTFDQRVRLDDDLEEQVKDYAGSHSLSIAAAIRLLLHKGLDAENGSKKLARQPDGVRAAPGGLPRAG
jgi:plasmid stability protein